MNYLPWHLKCLGSEDRWLEQSGANLAVKESASLAKTLYPSSLKRRENMIGSQRAVRCGTAVVLILVGVAAMATAWFILLTTATHNVNVVALELGGVVVCLAGYFLWKRSRRSECKLTIVEDSSPSVK